MQQILKLFTYCFLVSVLVAAIISLSSNAAEPPALKKIEKDGIVIEFLPKMEPVAQKIQPWLADYLAKHPFDMNQDQKKLKDNQAKIVDFVSKQLALDKPSEILTRAFPDIFSKFQNIGNVIPDIRRLQLWHKKDLKEYLDGGGSIPGYSYKPGKDGENELKMEQGFRFTVGGQDKVADIQTHLFPLILKGGDPAKYFEEATTTLSDMHLQFQKMEAGMSGLLLMMTFQPAVQTELRPPMRYFNWFTGGVAGYLSGQVLNDFISTSAAKYYIESQSIDSFVRLAPQIHLVKWIGNEPKDKPPAPQDEILKKARYAFSILEIMGLVARHNTECIPKIFTEIKKMAPLEKAKIKPETPLAQIPGQELANELDVLIGAIKAATGEDFRARLVQYSQISTEELKKAEAEIKAEQAQKTQTPKKTQDAPKPQTPKKAAPKAAPKKETNK